MPMILSVQEHLISKFQHNLISYLAQGSLKIITFFARNYLEVIRHYLNSI